MSFDTSKSKLSRSNFAVGYAAKDFTLHTSVNDGSEFAGSVYQRVNTDLETGVMLNWTAGSNATKFGMAAKYTLDKDSSVRVSLPMLYIADCFTTVKVKLPSRVVFRRV